jgi:hypothetical protein
MGGSKIRLIVALLPTTLGIASNISFNGVFTADNKEAIFDLTMAASSTITIQTFSYAGGGPDMAVAGGFAPELTLFDASGDILANDAVGGTAPGACETRGIDPTTGACLDALIGLPPLTLAAGSYVAVLTEQGNNPGATLSAGFSEDAAHGNDPTFTGDNTGLPGRMFIDPGNFSQRNGTWDVWFFSNSLGSVTRVVAAPEPGSALLSCAGILTFLFMRRVVSRPRFGGKK